MTALTQKESPTQFRDQSGNDQSIMKGKIMFEFTVIQPTFEELPSTLTPDPAADVQVKDCFVEALQASTQQDQVLNAGTNHEGVFVRQACPDVVGVEDDYVEAYILSGLPGGDRLRDKIFVSHHDSGEVSIDFPASQDSISAEETRVFIRQLEKAIALAESVEVSS